MNLVIHEQKRGRSAFCETVTLPKGDGIKRLREVNRASCVSAVEGAESSLELLPARESECDEQMESCGARRGTVTAWTVW